MGMMPSQNPFMGVHAVAPAVTERDLLVAEAKKLGPQILLLFFFTPWAFFLAVRATRMQRRLRALGAPVPGELTAALIFSYLVIAYTAAIVLGVAAFLISSALRPPSLWVANGRDEAVELTVDGQPRGTVALGSPRLIDISAGPHRLCVRAGGPEPFACATKDFRRAEQWIWNPEQSARFLRGVTHYQNPVTHPIDDQISFLPRAEWHRLPSIDYVFTDPPESIQMSGGGHETRSYLLQGPSQALYFIVDNGTELDVELVIDGVPAGTALAEKVVGLPASERAKQVSVRAGATTLVTKSGPFADFGTYVVDCTAGQVGYLVRTLGEGDAALSEERQAPAALHDVSGFESALGIETLRAKLMPTRGPRRVLDWAPAAPPGQQPAAPAPGAP